MKALLYTIILSIFTFQCFSKQFTILYTNDIHAKAEPFIARYVDENNKVGGFANVAAFVKHQKSLQPNSVFLDAGDYFAGDTIDTLSKGEAIVDIMNHMGYDAVSIGNHEFDYGWDNMLVRLSKAKFDVLLGNVFYEDTDKLVWNKAFSILERDGFKIGVIGMHGVFAFEDTVSAEMRQNIEARDEVSLTQKYINHLKPKVDLVVLLIHEGTPARQSSFGTKDVRRALDKDIKMAQQLTGLDILITGHAHVGTPKPIEINDTLILSTDAYGINVGKIVLDIDRQAKKIRSYEFELKTIWDKDWKADEQTQLAIDKWNAVMDEQTSKVLVSTQSPLIRSYGLSSNLGNLVADAILARFDDVEFAFTNSGGIRADIEAGDVTLADVIDALPFQNFPVAMTLSGAQIYTLLEHAAGLTNGVLQTSSGVYYEYDTSMPVGQRIMKVTFNDQKIAPKRIYRIATNNFLADGGDGFAEFTNGVKRVNIPNEFLFQTVERYLTATNSVLSLTDELRVHEIKNH